MSRGRERRERSSPLLAAVLLSLWCCSVGGSCWNLPLLVGEEGEEERPPPRTEAVGREGLEG